MNCCRLGTLGFVDAGGPTLVQSCSFQVRFYRKKKFFLILTVIKVGECIEDGTEEEERMYRRGEV